jgi:protein ImuB
MGQPSLSSSSSSFSFASARHKVWRGDELGAADTQVEATGHPALDAELPGGGWPVGAMTELLQDRPEAHVWPLLLPALARAVAMRGGPVVLIGAPHEPFGPALAAGGLPPEALLWVRSDVDEAVLLEVSGSLKLFGGRKALLHLLLLSHADLAPGALGRRADLAGRAGPAALQAARHRQARPKLPGRPAARVAHRRLAARGTARAHRHPHLGAGARHAARRPGTPVRRRVACRAGCGFRRSPGNLPLAAAAGHFDLNAELASVASTAQDLLLGAEQLLTRLQVWLQARNRGVLALELEWTLDLRRLNGVNLPPKEQLLVRTAQPTQDMAHLRRLVREHLERATLSAPANHLRLRSIDTVPWAGATTSLLPQDRGRARSCTSWSNACRCGWARTTWWCRWRCPTTGPNASRPGSRRAKGSASPVEEPDALYPSWVLPQPLRLRMQGETPCFGGPLRRLARLYRVETAWWDGDGPTLRDYFVARSPQSGLVWVYRERPRHLAEDMAHARQFAWYLQGLYA